MRRDALPMGQYIKKCREKAGLSQGKISQQMGYSSPQFISNWERGVSMPPMSVVAKLSKIIPALNKHKVVDIYLDATEKMIRRKMGIK